MLRSRLPTLRLLPLYAALLAPACAQNTNGTVRGQVLDPAGALIPNATVTVVNQQTGVTVFSGRSDSAGAFVALQVAPGTYRVVANARGLRQSVMAGLVVSVAQISSVSLTLQLGSSSESVTVQSLGEALNAATSDISTLIAPAEVQNLPLQGRATENLLSFIPGVAHGGPADQPNTNQLSINGSRTLNTEVLLNGVSTITLANGTPLTLPSPDGVDSFRVLTSNAPAEYGRTSGAVVSVNTISGTNTYHGSAYFLARNEALDANKYFNKLTLVTGAFLPRPRDRFFQIGASLGGPVRIPHLYNGHDHTFFFVNFDRTLQPTPITFTDTVPNNVQRMGNLAAALAPLDVNGAPRKPQPVYQPTGTTSPAFANNQVGPMDASAARVLALLPQPNTAGTYDPVNNRYTNNYATQQNLTGHFNKIVVRVDEAADAKDRLSFNLYRYTAAAPLGMNYNSSLLNTTYDCNCSNAWLPAVEYTRVWSSSLVMDLNMGYLRNVILRNPPGAGMGAGKQLGIASLPLDQTPEITDPGFSNIGSDTNTDQVNITNTYSPFGTVTKSVGGHTLRVGISLRKNQFNSFNPATSPEGMIQFDGSITNHGAPGNANTGIADFLLGKIKTASYEQPQPETGRRNFNLGVFLQDDWRAIRQLTVSAGFRYEYESPVTIANNIYSRIDPTNGALLVAGQNATRSLNVTTPKLDVSPRIGLAWAPDSRTVFRAAYGTFYGTITQNLGGQVAFPGYDNTVSYNNLGTAVAQPFSLSQGLPLAAPADLANPALALAASSASNPYTVGISYNNLRRLSMVQQYSFGFERRLPLALTFAAGYVGNHALHLPYVAGENQVPLAAAPAVTLANNSLATQNSLPFPNLKSFTASDDIGGSRFNSLQVSLRREFSSNVVLLSNYTWAKSLDDGSGIYNFSAPNGTANSQYPVDNPARSKDYTTGSLDIRNTFNLVLILTTGGRWYMRGFHFSPVITGHTGLPVNITQTAEIPGASQRPNGNPQFVRLMQPVVAGSAIQYFQSAADPGFPLTPSGPVYNTVGGTRTQIVPTGFGNVARNSNRAPGELDFDLSMSKDFKLYDRLRFQLRVDAFNVINHTNLGSPATALTVTADPANPLKATFATSTSFGQITTAQPNRTLQLSSRLFF